MSAALELQIDPKRQVAGQGLHPLSLKVQAPTVLAARAQAVADGERHVVAPADVQDVICAQRKSEEMKHLMKHLQYTQPGSTAPADVQGVVCSNKQ